jgi:hypothetical protein
VLVENIPREKYPPESSGSPALDKKALAQCIWPSACRVSIVTENGPVVGCCGWTEAQAKYVATFSAIEIQTTFYQPPGDAAARRWKILAPIGFRFCMKAWQLITHTPSSPTYRRLKSRISNSEEPLRQLSAHGASSAGLGADPRDCGDYRRKRNRLPVPCLFFAHTREHS